MSSHEGTSCSKLEHGSDKAVAAASYRLDGNTPTIAGIAYNASQVTADAVPKVSFGFYESFYTEIAVLVAIGIIGNSQLIALFQRRHRKVFRAVNLFMLLLAIIDLTACLWAMPYALLYVSRNLDSEIACKAGFYISGVIEMMSMTTSTMIAFERFHAVRNPHRPPTSRQAAYARVAGIHGFSFLLMSGLIAIMTVDDQGECNLSASRPRAIDIYLLALFATITLVYICDMVLYAFIFTALWRRGRMAARRRNTLSSIGSSGITRQRAVEIQSSHSIPRAGDLEKEELSMGGPSATTQREQPTRSSSMEDLQLDHQESATVGRRSSEIEREKHEPLADSEAAEATTTTTVGRITGGAAVSIATTSPPLVISFSKRSSLESQAELRTSRTLKVLSQQQQQQQQQHHSLPTATSPMTDGGRLSWSSEAGGTNWATQEVRSSAFLIIVLLSLVSWIPFFMSISFPSLLSLDAPHYRFLFFLNHVINIFVYITLSPHIRAQLKTNLLYPIRKYRVRWH